MLQVEEHANRNTTGPVGPARTRTTQVRTSRPQSRCSSSVRVDSPTDAKTQPRFDRESELTFSPKLNDSTLKLVQDRRDHTSLLQRASTPRETRRYSEFTFRPQMSSVSLKIAESLGTTFMARQEMHLEKQKKLLEQSKHLPLKGRLSPVTRTKKTKDKENSDNLAWNTPISTPNLTDNTSSHSFLEINNSKNDFHQAGIERCASVVTSPLNPVREGRGVPPMQSAISLQRISGTLSPYAEGSSVLLKKQKSIMVRSPQLHHHNNTFPTEGGINDSGNDSDIAVHTNHQRSRTVLSPESSSPRNKARTMAGHGSFSSGERLRLAKLIAEKALKKNKVFMIQGPYPVVRVCLRKRDWVEKQYRTMAPHKVKKTKNDSDDDSEDDNEDPDDDHGCHSDADDDNSLNDSDSVYGIMSRIVRNSSPSFIWTCRAGGVDYKFLRNNAYVNHFAKNSAFTTKVGLCTNLRTLSSLATVDPDSFFPRCYKICSDEEKNAFVDDYRLTAACSIVKWVVRRHEGELDIPMDDNGEGDGETNKDTTSPHSYLSDKSPGDKNNKVIGGTSLIDRAITIIHHYFSVLEHEDIDWPLDTEPIMTDADWDKFIKEYYHLIHDGSIVTGSANYKDQCSSLLNRLRATKMQVDMDGLRNLWIVKPGAKSRGRGIICMNKLEDIVKLVGSPIIQKEGKWVVQKYIEHPLLIYNTKFDIRQWFLVTDWNPLTVWFYTSCYLRFCGSPFSLEKLDSNIHLSNQSVQKNFEVSRSRSHMLPENNMWTSKEFQQYLKKRGWVNMWDDVIYPGMKKAVIAVMECCQDVVEPRKGSFELYGADFMLTEDFHPWLIEINSSPAMGATTEITEKMCFDVIEDTMKVVLDRKHDKNCDTGQFELAFKQTSVSIPQYIGQSLTVGGTAIHKPTMFQKQKSSLNLGSVPRLSLTTAPSRKQCEEPQRSKPVTTYKTNKALFASDDQSLVKPTNQGETKKKHAGTGTGKAGGGKHKRKKKGHGKRFRLPSLSHEGEIVRQELRAKHINLESSDHSMELNKGGEVGKVDVKNKRGKVKNALPPTKTLKAYAYFNKSQSHLQPPPLYADIPTIGSYHIELSMGVPGVYSSWSFHNKHKLKQHTHQMQSQSEVGLGGNSNAKYKPVKNPKLKLQHHERKHDRYFVYGPEGISVYSSI